MTVDFTSCKDEVATKGFGVIDNVYTPEEIKSIISRIEEADTSKATFRKSADLFAIRQFLKEIPPVLDLVLNANLKTIIREVFGKDYFIVKSIYFDKPETSNWYVARHQDLTISVDRKIDISGFGPWTVKQQQFAVQPPVAILESIFTTRIHLDNTDGTNGALKVITGSHSRNILRPEHIDLSVEDEVSCDVDAGGIMIMKPLLIHSSGRSTGHRRRRVIHIEFSGSELPQPLNWAEKIGLDS